MIIAHITNYDQCWQMNRLNSSTIIVEAARENKRLNPQDRKRLCKECEHDGRPIIVDRRFV